MSLLKQAGTHPSLKPDSPSAFLLNFSNTYLSTFWNEQQLYKGCYINDVFPGCLDWSPALLHSGMWSSLWLIEVISWALQRLLAGPIILCMTLQALWDLGRLFEFLVVLMSVLGRLTSSKETNSDGQVVIFWLVSEKVHWNGSGIDQLYL